LIVGHAVPEHKIEDTPPAPVEYVLIHINSHPGKYAMRGVKGDLLVAQSGGIRISLYGSTTTAEGLGTS